MAASIHRNLLSSSEVAFQDNLAKVEAVHILYYMC